MQNSILKTFLYTLLLRVTIATTNPYCDISKDHYLCDAKTGAHECPESAKFFPKTDDQRDLILDMYNEFRSSVASGNETRGKFTLPKAAAMNQMKWSKMFEASALYFIHECTDSSKDPECCVCKNIDGYQVRVFKIMSWYYGHKEFTIKEQISNLLRNRRIMKAFTLDILDVYKKNDPFDPIVFVANAKVSLIGCSQVLYKMNNTSFGQLACVLGSVTGLEGDPIYETGEPCTKCREGATCSERYRNLCKCDKASCKQRLVNAEDACRNGSEGSIKVDPKATYVGKTHFYDTDAFKRLDLGKADLMYQDDLDFVDLEEEYERGDSGGGGDSGKVEAVMEREREMGDGGVDVVQKEFEGVDGSSEACCGGAGFGGIVGLVVLQFVFWG